MGKLRLIKPWALQPVRQRINIEAQLHTDVCLQPCSGPEMHFEDERITRFIPCNIRTTKVATERSSARHTLILCEGSKRTSLNPRL